MFITYIANDDIYEDCVLELEGCAALQTEREASEAINDWISEYLTEEDVKSYKENDNIVTFNILNTDTKKIKKIHLRMIVKVVPFFVED